MIIDTISQIITTIGGIIKMGFFYIITLPFGMIPATLLQENLEQLLVKCEELAPVIEPILEFLYQIP